MARYRLLLLGVCGLLMAACAAFAAPPPTGPAKPADADRDAQALAARIDQYVAARWAANKLQPAPLADDAEYLRRVFLDLAGRIPTVAEVRAFLRDPSSVNRRQVVERLLDSPAYINHSATVWRSLLLPEVDASQDFQLRASVTGFEAWLRQQFTQNIGYDKMVRELVTAHIGGDRPGYIFNPYDQQGTEPTPNAFYVAKEAKPENLAASTARLFLGIKLECAQCHNHPFAKWSRQQFWEYAAFFAGFNAPNMGNLYGLQEIADRRELAIQGTGQVVQAAFLNGAEPQFQYKVNSRVTLADWLTAKDNPFFARAAVNRVWAQLFGIGIVEPVDDLSEQNIPSHPELLDELAREFAAHDFDLKFLIRAITATQAYQRSSAAVARSGDHATAALARSGDRATAAPDPRLFARMAVKGLSSEQLFESIALATGYRVQPMERTQVFLGGNTPRALFLAKFTSPDRPTEYSTSILQALALMNGEFVANATSLDKSTTLAAVADAPFLDTAGQIETLYLSTLSRPPRTDESERLVKYVKAGGPKKNSKAALGDVFWALLNSSEFILNH